MPQTYQRGTGCDVDVGAVVVGSLLSLLCVVRHVTFIVTHKHYDSHYESE
jgi:hypothetical protein